MTIYDPYYTQPLVASAARRATTTSTSASRRACDPDSYYRDLRELGRLEQHLKAQ